MKNTITYKISSGKKNAQYTLWEERFCPAGMDRYSRNYANYICNLGIDKDKAIAKATEIVKSSEIQYANTDVEIINALNTEFKLNKYGEGPVDVWDAENLHEVEVNGWFPFGKHSGVKFEDAPDTYVLWWAEKDLTNEKKKGIIALVNACKKVAENKNLFEKRDAEIAEKKRLKDLEPKSEHVGNVGDRQEFEMTIDFLKHFDTQFGTSSVVKGKNSDGNIVVYFGTAELGVVGDTVKFSAKIKTHDEFRDDKQTIVARPTKIKITEKGEATLKNEEQQELLNV